MSFRADYLSELPQVTPATAEALALRLFRHQAEHCAPYRQWLQALGCRPEQVQRLTDVPFLPIEFFKTQDVVTLEPGEAWAPAQVFRSSGTTLQQRSRHLVRNPQLYHQHAQRIFEQQYGPLPGWTFLALLPSYLEQGESSLVDMVEHFVRASGQPQQEVFFLRDHAALLAAIQQAKQVQPKRKLMLIGVTYALLDLLAAYPDHPALALPDAVLETGGMKGRRREMIREELHAELAAGFGQTVIHSEYGMTELLSQAYSPGHGRFWAPPALQILLREPTDPFSASFERAAGALNVVDLANVDSCAFLETRDLGRRHPDGSFEVLGRLDNSDIRGCSQLA
ncbi:acyl-CoA synthetase family protein [Hymenobacter jeollabukensis]|uniref:Acyl transferase n=1 Tax=Hymenobacter jeollabukensis TaxID=2025313 RepID=A0A5R8WXG5_9BACT|nr:acyl transferase [Hymenobacter jeollabukensis]TLM96922.1 acyl transferase [Hymenobacter jeollabukensis]